MILTYRCSSCWKENRVKGGFYSRLELAQKKGKKFKVICAHCGSNTELTPNSITARESKTVGFLFLIILIAGLLMSYILFTTFVNKSSTIIIGFILIIPILVYTTYSKSEMKKVKNFNRIKYEFR